MVAKQIEEQMSDRERDIRILEFCGWKWWRSTITNSQALCPPDETKDPNGEWVIDPRPPKFGDALFVISPGPRLSESLDQLFEFVIPAMKAKGYKWEGRERERFMMAFVPSTSICEHSTKTFEGMADTPARAVVAAVCAYLDGEGK